MSFTGFILGYDPGGNGSNGIALCRFNSGVPVDIEIRTVQTAEDVLAYAESIEGLKAIGIDTLTVWTTSTSGWRPADLYLRKLYKPVQHSITSPNSLAGSMGLNGMSVLCSLRESLPKILITETHPKVLHFALTSKKYDYVTNHVEMDKALGEWLGIPVSTNNDHEWDAVVSVLAAFKGISGQWQNNLHGADLEKRGRYIRPCGPTSYWWPEV